MNDATHSSRPANDTSFRHLDCAVAAKLLRAALKAELGASGKDVSVTISRYSMGESIDVVVRSLEIRVCDVQAIARRFESIDRDASGEILCGGNRFLRVSRDSESTEQLRALAEEQMKSAPLGGDPILFALSDKIEMARGQFSKTEWTVWHGDRCTECLDAHCAARVVVDAYLDLPRAQTVAS